MTAVNLNGLGASGPLDGFGALTALTELRLAYNRFSGAWEPRARAQAAALVSGLSQLAPWVKGGGILNSLACLWTMVSQTRASSLNILPHHMSVGDRANAGRSNKCLSLRSLLTSASPIAVVKRNPDHTVQMVLTL